MSLREQPSENLSAEQRELDEYKTRVRSRIKSIEAYKDGNE